MTVTGKSPAFAAVHDNVAVVAPGKVTDGIALHVSPAGNGVTVARLTVPVNPLTAAKVIVCIAAVPPVACTETAVVGLIVKSGGGVTLITTTLTDFV